jgi:hypothetical protein
MKYPLLEYTNIERYLPLIRSLKVSKVARSPNQFLDIYKRHGSQLPKRWEIKRENFIKRHYVQYMHNPTVRRRLALITWAFDPEYKS